MEDTIKGQEAKSRKFSAMFMLEVKANSGQENQIRFLIAELGKTISTLYPSAKVGITSMDREQ